ncbi:MAG: SMP-30/gluconolactonase/LRE family protein [Pseudomonadota bacterium]
MRPRLITNGDHTWLEVDNRLGEGVLVPPQDPTAVWWVDILAQRLFRCDRRGFAGEDIEFDVWSLPRQLGAFQVIEATGGAFVLEGTGERSLWRVEVACGEPAPRAMTELRFLSDEPAGNRFNDGALGPDGAWYAGTMQVAERDAAGRLLRFSADRGVETVDAGPYRVTNGPAFSPDGARMFHNDSAEGVTYVFDRQGPGQWSGKREFHRFSPGEAPDGMHMSSAGVLIVAVWGGARLDLFQLDGEPLGSIPLPARYPTRPALCAEENWVYVSSATAPGGDTGVAGGALISVAYDPLAS